MGSGTELLGLYWTISGPVEVHVGREWSLYDLRDRCAHAARVGFAGIGIWHADLEHVLDGGTTLADIGSLLDEYGLRYLELEFLGDWFLDPGDERRVAADRTRALLFEAAEVLPVHHIKAGNLAGTECELPRLTEAFGELCADAATHTDARIAYEFMPYDAVVNTLDTALEVVEGANAPNGGLAFDTWHLGKLEIEPDDLRRVPPRFVSWVELSDGPYGIADEWLDEVINRRRLPGEGDFPIRDYVRVFRELGYDGPWGVEVLSEELRALPIDEMFDRAYAASVAQLTTD
ncbi:MAG TPA: sugar phosphate isomerase/epimerase [Gaiellaceae bacterium]|nr:sugar phosphate isomerase/epimerase [Gaiellaceae bacterium]